MKFLSSRSSSAGLLLVLASAGVLSSVKASAENPSSSDTATTISSSSYGFVSNSNYYRVPASSYYTTSERCLDLYIIGNGLCQDSVNYKECGYDGGDCCSCTCQGEDCGSFGFACIDPEAPCVEDDDITEEIVRDCFATGLGDGFCSYLDNNELCGYDGGDCCSCTCKGENCGNSGYACIDPEAACVEDDDIDTTTGQNCDLYRISDGACDDVNNKAVCGYDGGDCCSCTCVSAPPDYYFNTSLAYNAEYNGTCGQFGYACIDPEAACVDDDDYDSSASIIIVHAATYFATIAAVFGAMQIAAAV